MRQATCLLVLLMGVLVTASVSSAKGRWALALHGGAGVIPKTTPAAEVQLYLDGLEQALATGETMLADGANSLDVVERVVMVMEDNPCFNAGKGAVFNSQGNHELDASIMEGAELRCGAVAGVSTVANPIHLARLVMETTPHVLLTGSGAEALAQELGLQPVEPAYFYTEKRYQQWQKASREKKIQLDHTRSTVGCVALDQNGNLAAATSTGGMTNKRYGRVGDSPIVGAGTYADNRSCAVSCTGTGEEFIRNAVAYQVAARMRFGGQTLSQAVEAVLSQELRPDDGGIIALDRSGSICLDFNTDGMFRAAASSEGRREIKIWR